MALIEKKYCRRCEKNDAYFSNPQYTGSQKVQEVCDNCVAEEANEAREKALREIEDKIKEAICGEPRRLAELIYEILSKKGCGARCSH